MPEAIDIANAIADRVRAGRAAARMTRKQLAAKAGVSERYLNELENGSANASIGIIAKVAAALDVPTTDLLAPAGVAIRGDTRGEASIRGGHDTLDGVVHAMSPAERAAFVPVAKEWLATHRRGTKGLALLGLRGAGKSTIGGAFASRHGIPLVSVTREIEKRAGLSLAELFNLGGPDAYRSMENDVVAELVETRGRIVLETAGGIAANSEALDTILARFRTVWLRAAPEDHLARVAGQGDTRPMQGNPRAIEHLKTLLASREPEYARAEFVIDTSSRSVEDCIGDLERLSAGLFDVAE